MKLISKSLSLCLVGVALLASAAHAQHGPRGPYGPGPGRHNDIEVRINTTLFPGERLPLIQVLDLDRGACGLRLDRLDISVFTRDRGLGELRIVSNDRYEEGVRIVGMGYSNVDFFLGRNNILCRDIMDLDLVNTSRVRIDIDTIRAGLDGRFERRPGRPRREREEQFEVRCDSRGHAYNLCAVHGDVVEMRLLRKFSDASCREDRSYGIARGGIWVDWGCSASFLVTTVTQARPEPRPYLDRIRCESINDRYNSCRVDGQALSVRLLRQESSADCREGRSFGTAGNAIWVDRGCRGTFEVEVRRY